MTATDLRSPKALSSRPSRSETRERLVRRGTELLSEYSFDATGIEVVLREVGVPKGSFYYYFSSKQAFVEAVIDNYAAYFARKFDRLLGDHTRKPLDRLRDWIDEARAGMRRHGYRRGCLIGNLTQELAAHNEPLRAKLEAVFKDWQERVAACLSEAIATGDLVPEADPQALAEFFWIGWEGAIMRAKLTRSARPLDAFASQFFAAIPMSPSRRTTRSARLSRRYAGRRKSGD